MKKKVNWKKKLVLFFTGVFFLLLGTLAGVPFFVDVDRYRPFVVQKINEHLDGKLELGRFQLSLWGKVQILIAGLSLKDSLGTEVLKVSRAAVTIPWKSLWMGSPFLEFEMDQPLFVGTQQPKEGWNFLHLLRKPQSSSGLAVPSPLKKGEKESGTSELHSLQIPETPLPAFILESLLRAQLQFQVQRARFILQPSSGETIELKEASLVIQNLGLNRLSTWEWKAYSEWVVGDMTLHGPWVWKGHIQVQGDNKFGHFIEAKGATTLDLSGLEIVKVGLFQKKSGLPFFVSGDFGAKNSGAVSFENVLLGLHTLEVSGSGSTHFFDQTFKVHLKTNTIPLGAAGAFSPLVQSLPGLGGDFSGQLNFQGTMAQPRYDGKVHIQALRWPSLKLQPDLNLLFQGDLKKVERFLFDFQAPGNHFQAEAQVGNWMSQPDLNLKMSSKGMDLDALMESRGGGAPTGSSLQPLAAKPSAPLSAEEVAKQRAAFLATDYDSSLEPLRKLEMMKAFRAQVKLDFASLQSQGVVYSKMQCQASLKHLRLESNDCHLEVFGGSIRFPFQLDLSVQKPKYHFEVQASQLHIDQAVASQMNQWRQTIQGLLSFSMKGHGMSFNPGAAIQNLQAQGEMKVAEAQWSSLDVQKMVGEGVNGALERLAEKYPPLREKKISADHLPPREAKYSEMKGSFSLKEGKMVIPSFQAQPGAHKGIEIKGSMTLGLLDYSLQSHFLLTDLSNLTQLKGLSMMIQGVEVKPVLTEGDKPFQIPVTVGCFVHAPCYSYPEIPEFLGRIVLVNMSQALKQKATQEVKKKASEIIQQHIPENIKQKVPDAVKDKLKGWF